MRDCVEQRRDGPLPSRVDALLAAQVDEPLAKPEQWAAIFLIERQVSPIDAYRRTYADFVRIWESCLAAAPDWPTDVATREAALTAHSIAYVLVSQSLIAHGDVTDAEQLRRRVLVKPLQSCGVTGCAARDELLELCGGSFEGHRRRS